MSYQFAHVNTYSRTASAGSGSGFSAQDIANEAERKNGACHHVKKPMPPTLLYGVMPSHAVKRSEQWAGQYKDALGRKLRADGLCLLAGVVSVPADFQEWDAYKKSTVEYLMEKYGDRLQSVVEHCDEANPHLHYYAVPLDGERMEDIHEGLRARNEARAAKKPTGEQNLAYKKAMEFFQKLFYERVSQVFGLQKDGPKKERKSRTEYLAEKAAGAILAAAAAEAQASKAKIKADEQKYITAREKFIENTKATAEAEKQKARLAGARMGKAEAEKKYGGFAGVVAVVREAIDGNKADAVAEMEAKHEADKQRDAVLINIHQQAALKATQRAEVATRSEKLKDTEIATLKTKLQALTPTATHCNHAPGNNPAPEL